MPCFSEIQPRLSIALMLVEAGPSLVHRSALRLSTTQPGMFLAAHTRGSSDALRSLNSFLPEFYLAVERDRRDALMAGG